MTVARFLARLRHDWLVVTGIVLVAAFVAGGYLATARHQYTSSAQVFVAAGGSSVSTLSDGLTFTQQIVKSFAELASSPVVVASAVDLVGTDAVAGHTYSVSASAPVDETTITVSVVSDSPQLAARLANALVTELKAAVPKVMGSSDRALTITLLQPATVATSPSSPQAPLVLFAAFFAALALVAAWIAVRVTLSRRVDSPMDVSSIDRFQDVAVLRLRGAFDASAIGLLESRVTAVVSDVAGRHVDVVGAALASLAARAGSRAIVIDLRRRSSTAPDDLWQVLSGRAKLEDLATADPGGFALLDTGVRDVRAIANLRDGGFRRLVESAATAYDQVVVLLGVGEELVASAGPVLRDSTRVLVVGALGRSRRAALADTVSFAEVTSGTLPDVVLVAARSRQWRLHRSASYARRIGRTPVAKPSV